MGEIADSLINGEFDYITGEYIGDPCGYPRTYEAIEESLTKQPMSRARQSCFAIMKARGIEYKNYQDVICKFIYSIGYKKLPNNSRKYKLIFLEHKNQFKKYVSAYKESQEENKNI